MTSSEPDPRPTLWVGHVTLSVPDPARSRAFFLDLGLRDAEPDAPVGILELRGGTHLLLLPSDGPAAAGSDAPFDLMVEDIEGFHALLAQRGHRPTEIESGPFHQFFLVREPGGHRVTVNSSHNTGLPV